MSYYQIPLDDLSYDTPYISNMINIGENNYIFTFQWSFYCECAFVSIKDYDDNFIVSGRALVNGLTIRNHNFPYILYFQQKNGETYEPTLDNIANDFMLFYDDEEMVE